MLKYLLLLLVLPCTAFSCPDITAAVTPTHHAGARDRLMATANGRTEAALVIGDSIAEQWPADMREPVIDRSYNFGLGGDRINNIFWRLQAANFFPGNRFTTIVVIAGTNNLGLNTPCEIAGGLVKLAGALESMSPSTKVYVVSILPRGEGLDTAGSAISEVNTTLAEASGVRFVNAAVAIRSCGKACYRPDHLHLERKGYAILGEALRKAMTAASSQ